MATCLLWALLAFAPAAGAQTGKVVLSPAEQAWIAAHPVVRVGLATEFPPYYFADERGRYEGFVIDLMDRLAERAGLRLEYKRYVRFSEVLDALRSKAVDLTPFVSETPARRDYLNFSRPLFSTQMVYVANRALGDVSPDARFAGHRVAAERLSSAADLLRERYPEVKLQEYDSAELALLAAAAGDADVFVGFRQVAVYYMEKHFTANLALRGVIAAPGTALGPAVHKDLPVLAGLLDRAIADLTTEEIAVLAAKWLPRSLLTSEPRANAPLSAAQRAWVKKQGSLRLGFDADFAPITFSNLAGGFEGLGADLTRAVAGKVGLILALEEGGRFAEVFDRARRGELDVVVAAAKNADRLRDFDFVGPFLRVPTVVVAGNDADLDTGIETTERRTLALLRQHFLIPQLRSRYPNLVLREYDTQAAVLQAVRHGEADLAIGNMKVVNQVLEARHAGALRTIGVVPQGDSELYFAVRRSAPELAGVLRTALDAITPAEMAAIENRWLRVEWTAGVPWARVLAGASVAVVVALLVIGSLWLGNRRLRQAQRTLEEARRVAEQQIEARSGFIAYLSHELRGALGGVAAGLKLLTGDTLGAGKARQLTQAMQTSAEGLLELCERTLDFERVMQGGVDLRYAPVPIGEVLDVALAPWRVQCELKGLELQLQFGIDRDMQVQCDALRLGQVIQNLVGNAVKFTARGRVRVTVFMSGAPSHPQLGLTVDDTGPGISAEEQERLFQPFRQGAEGRRVARGAGLGLSISKRIVEAMGGQVLLIATSPAGSRFEIRLPVPVTVAAGRVPPVSVA